jgi:hypothetical protein
MIEVLLKRLPLHYGLNPDGVIVSVSLEQKPFTEVDVKACNEAAAKDYSDGGFNKYEQIWLWCKST